MHQNLLIVCLLWSFALFSVAFRSEDPENSNSTLLSNLFGSTLYEWASDNSIVELSTDDALKGNSIIGVYFSASWCPPCQKFTPKLAQFYKEMKKKGKKFEIIWVSSDRAPEQFVEYYRKMPWKAVTWENTQQVVANIGKMYRVKGIPHLVLLNADDASVITYSGVLEVQKDSYGLSFPWGARSPLNFLPRPVRKFVEAQANKALQSAKNVLNGILAELAPTRLMSRLLKMLTRAVKAIVEGAKAARNSTKQAEAAAVAGTHQAAAAVVAVANDGA